MSGHTHALCRTFFSNYPTFNVSLFYGRSPYQVPAKFMDLYSQEEDVYTQVFIPYKAKKKKYLSIYSTPLFLSPVFTVSVQCCIHGIGNHEVYSKCKRCTVRDIKSISENHAVLLTGTKTCEFRQLNNVFCVFKQGKNKNKMQLFILTYCSGRIWESSSPAWNDLCARCRNRQNSYNIEDDGPVQQHSHRLLIW